MKVGDLVDHRNGGPRSVLGGGLIIRMRVWRDLPGVDVLWSKTGKVRWMPTWTVSRTAGDT